MSHCWVLAQGLTLCDFYASLASIAKSVDETERFLDTNDVRNKAIHTRQLAALKRLVFAMGSMYWEDFRDHVTDEFLMLLQLLGSDLSECWHEVPLSSEDLGALQSEIEEIISDVAESDLDDVIKLVIVDGLNAVRNAILEYRVRGAEGIRQALDRNIALIFRYRQEIDMASQHDQGGLLSRWLVAVGKLDALVATGLKIKQLAQPVMKILMPSETG